MSQQLKMFSPPSEDPAKISSLIRSNSSHELGLSLASINNYNLVDLLIDSIYFHLESFETWAWGINCYQYVLFKGLINKSQYSLVEQDSEEFYLIIKNENQEKVKLKVHEWGGDTWEQFNLAKLAEKEIRKNRQYIDAVLKDKA